MARMTEEQRAARVAERKRVEYARMAAAAKVIVDAAPPLTAEQVIKLRRILAPAVEKLRQERLARDA